MKFTKIALLIVILSVSIISQVGSLTAQFVKPDLVISAGNVNLQNNLTLPQMGIGGFGGGGKPVVQPENSVTAQISDAVSETIEKSIQTDNLAVYVDPRISEQFNISSEIPVIVKVRDTSGISISSKDSIEQQNIKDLQRKELLGNKMDSVLSKLPADGFKLKGKFLTGRGFYGSISKAVFDKLINDSDVGQVYYDGKGYIGLDKSRSLINADDVETAGYNGTYQTICVLDTGINYTQAALGGCLGSGCKVRFGWDYIWDDAHPDDETGHGTNVAGIIASQGATYRGIAPDVRLVALKVCNATSCPDSAVTSALSLCYVYRNVYNISVVSESVYDHGQYNPSNCPTIYDDEINDLQSIGIPFITISGNDGHTNGISYPGCSPNAIPVGAVYDANLGREPDSGNYPVADCYDENAQVDNITCFTSRKSGMLNLLAPGCRIQSMGSGVGSGEWCGTSQAAPHISGVAAVLKQLNKSLSPDDIENILKDTGVSNGDYKRVDALAAINSVRDTDSDGYFKEDYGGNDCNDNDASIHPGATESCDGKDNDCDSSVDEDCEYGCSESGYEQCYSSQYGDCNAALAINMYGSVNNIHWGSVSDSSDPYVIGSYRFGWKKVTGKKVYYNVNDPDNTCNFGGCPGQEQLSAESTKVTVSAPGTAHVDLILSHNNATINWCWAGFTSFDPNYGASNPIYVLNCFDDSDCSSNQFCDKSGSWSSWACVTKYSNGHSCTADSVCSSNYCDNDGVGLVDDGWCFTPYSTYFDGQETSYCEYSADNGIADCDERQVGEDLNKCVGTSYYEEECGSTCNYQDVTSLFECVESGCSCSEALCDGGTTGTNITTCAANNTYFADKCTSIASGEDRSDNICRSSAFASGCTANSLCNAVTAGTSIGTGSCSQTCLYDAFPNVTLVSPANGNISATADITFNCLATDDFNLVNVTLYHNITGFWLANETKNLTGTADSKNFTVNDIPDGMSFVWNCRAYDNASQTGWADANYTVTMNIPEVNVTISSLAAISSSGTYKIFEATVLNNGGISLQNVTWTLDSGDGTIINSTYNASFALNESLLLYAEHNYSSQGNYIITINITANQGTSTMLTLEVSAGALSVSNLSVLNSSGSLRTFEAYVKNYLPVNMTNVSWSLNTGNGIVSSTSPITLQPQEAAFVFVQHNYTSAGTFTANFTAVNGSWSDVEALNVTV